MLPLIGSAGGGIWVGLQTPGQSVGGWGWFHQGEESDELSLR